MARGAEGRQVGSSAEPTHPPSRHQPQSALNGAFATTTESPRTDMEEVPPDLASTSAVQNGLAAESRRIQALGARWGGSAGHRTR